jgi:hypothetical protein
MLRNERSKMRVAGKRKSRVEEQHQVAFVAWFRTQYPQYSKLLTLGSFGENIGQRRMARLKQMGLTPGYPDILICLPKARESITYDKGEKGIKEYCHHTFTMTAGLYIEMKTKKGKVSALQAEIHKLLAAHSYTVGIAYDWEEAKAIVIDYLSD